VRSPFGWFLLKRLAQAVVVVFFVTLIVFGLLHALPGGVARGILGAQASNAEIASFNRAQGFDKPLPVQYWMYLSRLLHANLGTSYKLNQSVGSLIASRLPRTLVLTGVSTAVAFVVAVPLGVWQAIRRRRLADYVITTGAFVGYATPVYFLALLLVIVFNADLHLLPSQVPGTYNLGQLLAHPSVLVLPVVTLAVPTIAVFSRYTRSAVLDNLSEDYTRTARAKGAPERRVVGIHVLRNSLTPVIAMLGYYVPVMFSGAIVVEEIFNFPGMGLLFWNAAQTSDYPVLLGVILLIALATVTGSLLADIAQAVADPRVRSGLK
jgi:peptide/nickel transport system permease protein